MCAPPLTLFQKQCILRSDLPPPSEQLLDQSEQLPYFSPSGHSPACYSNDDCPPTFLCLENRCDCPPGQFHVGQKCALYREQTRDSSFPSVEFNFNDDKPDRQAQRLTGASSFSPPSPIEQMFTTLTMLKKAKSRAKMQTMESAQTVKTADNDSPLLPIVSPPKNSTSLLAVLDILPMRNHSLDLLILRNRAKRAITKRESRIRSFATPSQTVGMLRHNGEPCHPGDICLNGTSCSDGICKCPKEFRFEASLSDLVRLFGAIFFNLI